MLTVHKVAAAVASLPKTTTTTVLVSPPTSAEQPSLQPAPKAVAPLLDKKSTASVTSVSKPKNEPAQTPPETKHSNEAIKAERERLIAASEMRLSGATEVQVRAPSVPPKKKEKNSAATVHPKASKQDQQVLIDSQNRVRDSKKEADEAFANRDYPTAIVFYKQVLRDGREDV